MTNTVRELLYLTIFAILIVLLSGCGMKRLPADKDYKMIQSGELSVVLLRITCDVGGKSYVVFKGMYNVDGIGLALSSFETGGEPRPVVPVFPSDQAQEEGWTYFLLKPGQYYYLAVLPPRRTNLWTYESMFKYAPLYKFYVPPKTELVYVGTLHLQGISKKLLFGGETIASFINDSAVVRNEEEIASMVAAEFFTEIGIPKTMLMEPHEGPIILKTPESSE